MSLKYVAACLLCHYAGTEVSKSSVTKVIESIGADVEGDVLSKLLSALEGKDVAEVLNAGMGKLSAAPVGGAAAPAAAAAAGGAAKAEEKPAEKEPEPEEEEDDDMGFGLFD